MATAKSIKISQPDSKWIGEVIDALAARVSWILVRKALKQQKMPIGQGWSDLHATAKETNEVALKLSEFLESFHRDTVIAGDRYIQLHTVDQEFVRTLQKSCSTAAIPHSKFNERYPLPLKDGDLPLGPAEPTLCEIRSLGNGDIALVFCSVNSFDDKTTYEYKELSDVIRKAYGDIDRLITVRRIHYQAFDVVVVRKSLERVEVSVDQPTRLNASGLETKAVELLSACAKIFPQFIEIGTKPPENLFPAIASIYTSRREGRINFLAFRTLTGSVKREKMTSSNSDLRLEQYHHAGMRAVNQHIKPFEIEAEWEFKSPSGAATIKLVGLISQLALENPTLHGCYVKASKSELIESALNRLVSHI